MRLLVFLIFLFAIFGSKLLTSDEISVCTLNIRWDNPGDGKDQWKNRRKDVVSFFAVHEPDVFGLQEALHHQIQYVDSSLHKYSWVGVGRDDGKIAGEFCPIFYNRESLKLIKSETFWLSEDPSSISKSWDAALPRICTVAQFFDNESESTFTIFNTHFDHIGINARLESAKLISRKIEELSGFKNVILMGDLNAEPSSRPIQHIISTDMKDAYESSQVKFGLEGTFNGFNYETEINRRIDYVFGSSNLKCLKYAVFNDRINGHYLSDHFPVFAEFTFQN